MESAILSYEEALAKLQRFCAYQERSHQEVRTKLLSLQVYGDQLEQVMATLVQEGFLNELRFAITFTSGKYRLKAWGRNKINQALKAKNISDYCIEKALSSIDEMEYKAALELALRKYHFKYRDLELFPLRGKMFHYAQRKGYLAHEINPILDFILEDTRAIYKIE